MDPRLGRSAFTINFSNPNAFVKEFPVIPPASHPTASSSQLDVLAQCSSYNLLRGTKRKFVGTSRLGKWPCDSRSALAKAGLDLELPLSVGPSQSTITDADSTAATAHNNPCLQPYIMDLVPTVDEGSTSARRPSGGQLLSFLNKNAKMSGLSPRQVFPGSSNQTQGPAPMPTLLQLPKSPAQKIVRPQQRSSSTKNCSYTGCVKGARGSSERCIAHGGRRRCQKEGCGKGAEDKTIFCKAHGVGRRCGNILSMFANGMSFGNKSTNNTEASTSAPRNWKSTNGVEASTSSCSA